MAHPGRRCNWRVNLLVWAPVLLADARARSSAPAPSPSNSNVPARGMSTVYSLAKDLDDAAGQAGWVSAWMPTTSDTDTALGPVSTRCGHDPGHPVCPHLHPTPLV